MKMKCYFLLLLYFAENSQKVQAGNDHDVKRGMHPFMAFIYYSDPLVLDISGQRFVRSAVLIRPDWLVTTAMGPSLMDPPNGFPEKTLLARAGAITIDSKFTLNEDEDEQEREIVQIVRPYNHSATQWWTTDISLMKTLLPFNMTSAVGVQMLNFKKPELIDPKICTILIYTKKYGNATEEKNLMVLFVDLLPPSITNCGTHFASDTMACAADSDDNRDAVYDPEFCQGNSGGPLLCSNDVVGLQTYIGNDCKQPHLYQLLFPWDNFIICAIEDKCQEEQCGSICDVIYKDPPKSEVKVTQPVTRDTTRDMIDYINIPSTPTQEITFTDSKTTESTTVINTESTAESDATTTAIVATFSELVTLTTLTVNLSETTTMKETEVTIPETTTSMSASVTESTIVEMTEKVEVALDQTSQWTETKHTSVSWPKVIDEDLEKVRGTSDTGVMTFTKSKNWPNEHVAEDTHNDEEIERKAGVEAQQEPVKELRHYNRAASVRILLKTVFFGFTVLLCL